MAARGPQSSIQIPNPEVHLFLKLSAPAAARRFLLHRSALRAPATDIIKILHLQIRLSSNIYMLISMKQKIGITWHPVACDNSLDMLFKYKNTAVIIVKLLTKVHYLQSKRNLEDNHVLDNDHRSLCH